MHIRRTSRLITTSLLVEVNFVLLLKDNDKLSYIFAVCCSTKRNGNCGNGRKKSPNYKKL